MYFLKRKWFEVGRCLFSHAYYMVYIMHLIFESAAYVMCSYFCMVTHFKYTFKINILRYSNGGNKRSELERLFDVDENG